MRFPRLVLMMAMLCGTGACFLAGPEIEGLTGGDLPVGPIDAGSPDAGEESEPQTENEPPADPSCPIDRWENDDTFKQGRATPVRGYGYINKPFRAEGLTACLGDEDWIHISPECCASGAIVRWDASVGPLEVDLFDSNGTLLSLNGPDDVVERQPGEVRLIQGHGPSHRHLLVRVRASGAVSVPYSVDLIAPLLL
jgi:hypothetical protein